MAACQDDLKSPHIVNHENHNQAMIDQCSKVILLL